MAMCGCGRFLTVIVRRFRATALQQAWDGSYLMGSVYDDGAIKVWNMKTADMMKTISVVCMDCHHDNSMVMTGSTDIMAKVVNTSTGKVLSTFKCDSMKEGENSVEACCFCR
ncbi:angio-associated migratory cell protein-like, partial [Mizuhopecten yessoensis]|uniref:angio-associated migratory cell protein-like n=1 Tax=Mizuhopecten yessoensis TaxID=6573 RepID=UPI000B45CE71